MNSQVIVGPDMPTVLAPYYVGRVTILPVRRTTRSAAVEKAMREVDRRLKLARRRLAMLANQDSHWWNFTTSV